MTPIECQQHGGVWFATCLGCRAARRVTLVQSVQSCTVHGAPHVLDQRVCVDDPLRALVGSVRRTTP